MHEVGSRAGAGKSYVFADIAIERAIFKKNTVIIASTVRLSQEIRENIRKKNTDVSVHLLHGDDGSEEAVTLRVRAFLEACKGDGDILINTHQCFLHLPYFPNKIKWRLLVDESISVFATDTLNIHESHAIITEHIEIEEEGPLYSKVRPRDRANLKRIVDNKNKDDLWKSLHGIGSKLLHRNYDCYVLRKQYNELIGGLKPKGQLTLYSLRRPDQFKGFEQVTFAAAGFRDTLAFYYWGRLGVEWCGDEEIEQRLYRKVHPYNPRLTIYFGYPGRNSKNRRNRLEKDGNSELWDKAKQMMRGEPFLALENKDWIETSPLTDGGTMLPPVSAGLNGYTNYRHAIIFPAYNHTPGASQFLSSVARFDRDMQDREMNLGLYQACMRTVIRKDDIDAETRWVVACELDAQLLSERLPGSVVKPLGLAPLPERKTGRPRKHATDNDRKREYERRRKDELTRSVGFARDLAPDLLERVVFLDKKDESTYRSIGNFVRDFRGSYFKTWFKTDPLCVTMTEGRFICYLKERFKDIYFQKDDIPCISGALFDPALTANENTRYEGNVALSRGIWIDIEDGDLTPKLFEQAFPHLPFVAYGTFRHTKQKPRFRIYIPTDRPMLFEESVAIYHEIRYSLKTQGWMSGKRTAKRCVSIDRHFDGIDCRPNPSQLSVLPCQSQDRKASFFIDNTKGKDPLKVDVWLEQRSWFEGDDEFYDLSTVPDDGEEADLTPEQIVIIKAATDRWENFGRQDGNGDAGIFSLYLELRRACIPITVIEWRLYRAAEQSSSPSDRNNQVRRLIQNLRRKAF